MTLEVPRRFELRILQWSWGLHIDFVAQVVEADNGAATRLGLRSSVRPVGHIHRSDLDWAIRGLARVSEQIDRAVDARSRVVIEILEIEYPLTDYQDEAIALAASAWAAEEFGFEFGPSEVGVRFDRSHNRYVIEYW